MNKTVKTRIILIVLAEELNKNLKVGLSLKFFEIVLLLSFTNLRNLLEFLSYRSLNSVALIGLL